MQRILRQMCELSIVVVIQSKVADCQREEHTNSLHIATHDSVGVKEFVSAGMADREAYQRKIKDFIN